MFEINHVLFGVLFRLLKLENGENAAGTDRISKLLADLEVFSAKYSNNSTDIYNFQSTEQNKLVGCSNSVATELPHSSTMQSMRDSPSQFSLSGESLSSFESVDPAKFSHSDEELSRYTFLVFLYIK